MEIVQDEAAHTIHLTVVEGSGQGDMACIELAELRATAVDLRRWRRYLDDLRRGRRPAIKLDVP